ALALTLLSGCASTYWFHTPAPPVVAPGAVSLPTQLAAVLTAEGFQSIGKSALGTGDLGCGETASDRQTFQKQWPEGSLFGPSQTTVWVHEFTCNQLWYAVIVSSGVDSHAQLLRDVLMDRFAKPLKAGSLIVETKQKAF
ncbi:MAG: hypothetical protein ABI629_21660, partial [bacterium]